MELRSSVPDSGNADDSAEGAIDGTTRRDEVPMEIVDEERAREAMPGMIRLAIGGTEDRRQAIFGSSWGRGSGAL